MSTALRTWVRNAFFMSIWRTSPPRQGLSPCCLRRSRCQSLQTKVMHSPCRSVGSDSLTRKPDSESSLRSYDEPQVVRFIVATAVAGPRRRYWADNERVLAPLLLSPAVVYIIALVGFPFVLAIMFAFSDVTTGNPDLEFVGLRTFGRILEDPVFLRSLWNTFVFALVANALVVVLAKALAMVLIADFKGKWLVRFLVLLPWTTPISLATITWLWTLDSIFSPIDWILRNL